MRRLLLTFLLCSTWMVGQSKISDNQIRTPPPLQCSDTTTSGTTQSCTTAPSFTPAAKDCVTYNTTTTNTGALTLNVNSQGAKPVQKWLGSALVAGDVVANKPQLACYDGTNWQLSTIGNAPGTGSGTVTSVATTSPIAGGTITSTGTITCTTCLTATSPTNHGVLLGAGSQAVGASTAGTSGQVLTSNGASSDPTFQAAAGGTTAAVVGTYCSTSGGGANTISCSTDFNVKANTLIVAFCGSGQSGGLAFADSGPGGGSALTWTAIATATNNTGATLSEKAWWANPGSASGSDTFTCTLTNTSSFNGLAVYGIAGVSLTSPVDASATLATNGALVMQLAPTNTNDIVMYGLENSGTATQGIGFFFPLNDTGQANASGYAINGPYNFKINIGTHGAMVAVALH